jgi:hypothetical protein
MAPEKEENGADPRAPTVKAKASADWGKEEGTLVGAGPRPIWSRTSASSWPAPAPPVDQVGSFSSTEAAAWCPRANPRRARILRMLSSVMAPRPFRPSMKIDSGPERMPRRR